MNIKALFSVFIFAASVAFSQSTDVDSIRKSAEQGNSSAQFKLAHAYDFGDGVTKDHDQAIIWYQKAATQGDAGAQSMIGFCYEIGYGLPQDFVQAVVWFKKAADQGSAVSEAYLGYSYAVGKGVPENYALGASWSRKAADQGDSLGQAILGQLYESGLGVPQNHVEAYFWLNVALAGDLDGLNIRDQTEKSRKEAAAHLTKQQMTDVQERGTRWIEDKQQAAQTK